MKKCLVITLVLAIAALSVMSACAAPRERYYDQMGNKYWCNVDSDGCWVTGEEGEHIYIMFWSAASAAKFMGADSNAPLGIHPGTAELPLLPPQSSNCVKNCLTDHLAHKALCLDNIADPNSHCTAWDECSCGCLCGGSWFIPDALRP